MASREKQKSMDLFRWSSWYCFGVSSGRSRLRVSSAPSAGPAAGVSFPSTRNATGDPAINSSSAARHAPVTGRASRCLAATSPAGLRAFPAQHDSTQRRSKPVHCQKRAYDERNPAQLGGAGSRPQLTATACTRASGYPVQEELAMSSSERKGRHDDATLGMDEPISRSD